MIILVISGGIGSQLFQYAAACDLAKKTNSKIYLDICFFNGLNSIPGKPELAPNIFNFFKVVDVKNTKIIKNIWISRLFRFSFFLIHFLTFGKIKYQRIDIKDPFAFEKFPMAKNYFINGYPNNLGYIKDTIDEFLSNFFLKKKEDSNKIKIGLHVRRSDFIDTDVDICGKEYYKKAIIEFYKISKLESSNVKFLIFCQEIDWPKNNIDFGRAEIQYIIGDHHTASEEFKEMCDCDHLIMPNSSFSWWPAQIISRKKNSLIFCPDLWWNKIDINKIDIYPKNWKVISTGVKARKYPPL